MRVARLERPRVPVRGSLDLTLRAVRSHSRCRVGQWQRDVCYVLRGRWSPGERGGREASEEAAAMPSPEVLQQGSVRRGVYS